MRQFLWQLSIILTLLLFTAQANAWPSYGNKAVSPKEIRVNFENYSHKDISFTFTLETNDLLSTNLKQKKVHLFSI